MKKSVLIAFVFIFCNPFYAQNNDTWKKIEVNKTSLLSNKGEKTSTEKPMLFQLDFSMLNESLKATNSKTSKRVSAQISMPNSKGDLESYLIWESSNFEPELQAKYPEIRAYEGKGISDVNAKIHFSISPNGIQSIVLRSDTDSEFIESYPEDKSLYVVFSSSSRKKGDLPFKCNTEDKKINTELRNKTAKSISNTKVFKTLRLALSCTGEYTTYHGGTVAGALAAMNATMTRVNAVFNRDLAVKLNIIANNTSIIYTNAATDPYSNASSLDNWGIELQNTLTAVITDSNYDIGHLFGGSGGGGDAGCIGCICVNPTLQVPRGKGSAYTSPSNGKPEGDTFDIDYVAHEMGHQLGGNHTFSYEIEGTGVSVEPGSGSTIMGYAGVSDGYDVQTSSDDYFAYASILQIQNNLASKTCPISTNLTNNPPVISAGLDYTIPKSTAFILKGTGSDPEGDSITYCWEQNDSAITSSGINSFAVSTKTDGPLFRSFKPVNTPIRYMPSYENVLANKLTSSWESVSNVARTLHFVLTGRDNAALGTAQTNSDGMIVNVSGSIGPFAFTSQNTDNIGWLRKSNQTITWSVNGSNTLPGASNVNIKLSYNGGLTFPVTLASNVPNDGSELITVPDVTEKNCRLLIEPTNNIFYAINSTVFSIGYDVQSGCDSYTYTAPFAIPEKATYTTRTIDYPSTTATISDVNFNVSFTHTYLSDVQIDVISPQGTIVKLFERGCGTTNGTLLLAYDDSGVDLVCGVSTLQTVTPYENLAKFNNENPSGIWTFRIRDAFPNDLGTLNSASIDICTKTYVLSKPKFKIADFVIHPNPSNGEFNVYFVSDSTAVINVTVYDVLGKIVYKNEYPRTEIFNEQIQITNAQSGVYFLRVEVGGKEVVKKILIE